MKWSWKIGEFAGIGLFVHATFPLLLAFVALPSLIYDRDVAGALASVAFILVLFVCVVLHEYGLVLVLFNLIPAFPMDGGRILRALLATRLDYAQATRYAAWLGQGIAVLFAIGGFFLNPLLIITALFIFMGAQGESNLAQQRNKM